MKDRKWRHHYVPQYYLRRFTSTPNADKKRQKIWFYDKQTGETDEWKIMNVAYKPSFYDLPLAVLPSDFASNVQDSEDTLGEIERHQQDVLTTILDRINKGEKWLKHSSDKYNLAAIVAVMHLRTPSYRIVFEEILKTFSSDEIMRLTEKELEIEDLHGPIPQGDELIELLARRIHQTHLHNPSTEGGMTENMAMFLAENFIWIIGENTSAHPFYTSDKPIQYVCVADCPEQADCDQYATIASPGTVAFFPVSPRYAIFMFDRAKHGDMAGDEGSLGFVEPEIVTFWNEMQVRDSERFVFSCKDCFDTARTYLNENPQCRNPTAVRAVQYAELSERITAEIRRKLT